MREIIKNNPVIAIMRDIPDEVIYPYILSLYAGGIKAFEISFSNEYAEHQIQWLKGKLPENVKLGAGTIVNEELAKKAEAAGADFMLSPSCDECAMRYCSDRKIPMLPGVFTPSDVSRALAYGYDLLKMFPAKYLEKGYLKALKGPFPEVDYVAVGGVTIENIKEYLNMGYCGVGIGNGLVNPDSLKNAEWEQITVMVKQNLQKLQEDVR